MADLKPVGSEKLPLNQKLRRIMEIATFGDRKEVSDNSYTTVSYSKQSPDGNVYAIIQENSNYIIKKGKDLNSLDYLDGMGNSNKQTFSSYSKAFKKLNLMFKPLNEKFNGGNANPLIGEQTKYVLNTPTPEVEDEEEEIDFSVGGDDEGEDMDMDMGGEDLDLDMGDEEMDMDVDVEVEKKFEDPTKTIQKLTGKLGQKLREFKDEIDADMIKYVINSVISAIDVSELTSEDVEDIVEKLEEKEEDIEYTEEGEFDVDLSGEEELDLDMGGDDEIEMDLEEGGGHIKGEKDTTEMWANLAKLAAGAAGAAAGEKLVDKYLEEDMEELDEQFDEMIDDEEMVDQGEVQMMQSKIEDIFNESRPEKINNSIKKYFKYTKQELKESENARLVEKELKKHFVNEKLKKATTIRDLKNSFKSYEQERLVTSFIKENKGFKYLGQNRRGDIVLQENKKVVQITPKGKIIK